MAGRQESHCAMKGNATPRKASGSNGTPKAKPGKGKEVTKKAAKNQY